MSTMNAAAIVRTVYTLTIGPDDYSADGIAWSLAYHAFDADGEIIDAGTSSGGRATRGAPSTEAGWLAYCRRHGGEIRPASWRHLRWSDADIREGGYDYRNGAVLTWTV
jgi:hypothetical protein